MVKFLVDENLSPLIAQALRAFDYDAKAARELSLVGRSDKDVIQLAAKDNRIIVTGDIEFGELFYRHRGRVSMVVLRSKSAGIDGFMDVLRYLHTSDVFDILSASNYLVLASAGRHRIRKFPTGL